MELIKLSNELNRLLYEAMRVWRKRNRLLDQVANGELKLNEDVRTELTARSTLTRKLLETMGESIIQVSRVVSNLDCAWGQPPESFRDPYLRLHERTYGTRAQKVLDTEVQRAAAKRVSFPTRSDRDQKRGGAKPPKNPTPRNVVIDHKAFTFKRDIDRRLRFLSSDIREFLSGGSSTVASGKMCNTCSRFAGPDWAWCPWCGKGLGC